MKKVDYPYLPENRVMKYVSLDNKFMCMAYEYAWLKSTDLMQPTGAIIVKNNKVIGRGANQSAYKSKYFRRLHQDGLCLRKILKIKSGTKYWLCPGCSQAINHAEAQAVKDALKNKFNTNGADLYVWGHWWCCKPCWDAMIKAGINNVFLAENSQFIFKAGHPKNILGKQFE